MKVNLELLKKLRQQTNVGYSDCRKALEETNNNFEEATKWLIQNGITKGLRKNLRNTTEGIVKSILKNNNVVMCKFLCESDFVAQNEIFKKLIFDVTEYALSHSCPNKDELLNAKPTPTGQTITELIAITSSKIGENIVLADYNFIKNDDLTSLDVYNHFDGKSSVTCVFSKNNNTQVMHDICLHIAGLRPQYLNQSDIPKNDFNELKNAILKEIKSENELTKKPKPDSILERIAFGKIQKQLREICLMEQIFIKDDKYTIKQILEKANIRLIKYYLWEI